MITFSMDWSENDSQEYVNTANLWHNVDNVGTASTDRPFWDKSTYQHLLSAEINVSEPNVSIHT
jgi:hypothetical protein